eukprot:m.54202 g.54202  ORF g.54202 m.54202 type:complete len:714 (+) comp21876_c0_seq1:230-2371(+)
MIMLSALVSALVLNVQSSKETFVDNKLNVLMLAADDLRPQLGCYSPMSWVGEHVTMHTPEIDAFANSPGSIVFLNSYCQQAICGPSRSSLLTGRRPDTTKVRTIGPYWRKVGGNFTSLPQHFKENGYTSVGHGKIFHPGSTSGGSNSAGYVNPGPTQPWIIGDDYPYAWTTNDPDLPPYFHAPNKMFWQCSAKPGYNTTCPPGGMGHRITPSMLSVNASLEADVPLMDDQIATQAVKTLGILNTRTDNPWFVAVGFHLPHLPELVPERFVDLYPDPVDLPDNQFAPHGMPEVAWSHSSELLGQYADARALDATGAINTTLPPTFTRNLRRHYYGAVSYIDYQMGRVLTALKDNNQQHNTIVALWGDHGYQLGEHGLWCKVTNFELATHTALIMSWPGLKSSARSSAFVEFVDIFPTLSDLAGIAIPPLCPPNSANITLCTEGVSLRPLFIDPTAEVKTASFSQYQHGPRGVTSSSEIVDEPDTNDNVNTVGVDNGGGVAKTGGTQSDTLDCATTVLGQWYAADVSHPTPGDHNVFVFTQNATTMEVVMDSSGCHDCSFESAIGRLTPTGVDITLHFKGSQLTDHQIGTLRNDSCVLEWTSNSTDASGHWTPFYRNSSLPPSPPSPPSPSSELFMGYTMITRVSNHEYRYTEWPRWIGSITTGTMDWSDLAGLELYNHSDDAQENTNIVASAPVELLANLSTKLRAGWRAARIL